MIDLSSQGVIYFLIKFFKLMVMQPSFHPADGITHGAVMAQIKFLTYFFQTLAASIPQKIDGKVTRLDMVCTSVRP